MEIKKELVVSPMTSDNKVMEVGKGYVFNASEKCFVGTYMGISKYGALMFESSLAGEKVQFNVMPKSITSILNFC